MARYDTIGHGYSRALREDPRFRALIHAALGDARTVVNVGAGAYEPSDWFLLAERAGHLVAFAECSLYSSPPLSSLSGGVELVRLYVQGRSQRSGVGAALLAKAEAHGGCVAPLLWLTAWVGNTNARAFYRAQGYDEVGSTCYARFGFRPEKNLVLADVPPEYFQAISFSESVPQGIVRFHEAFGAQG